MSSRKSQSGAMAGQMALDGEVVIRIPLADLYSYPNHPYGVREDEAMKNTEDSIRAIGVVNPAIVRPLSKGGYESIAGHRRKVASERAGYLDMPCIIRNLNDDEAIIQLVDSNAQRDIVLPSEKAKAYKMRLEAIKRQGARSDLAAPNDSAKFRSDDAVGQAEGVSGDTVRNMISLNNLVPEIMQMVDAGKISLTPAYQIANLTEQEQRLLLDTMDSEQTTPSVSQAQRMKKLSQNGKLNEDTMLEIMMEQKKPENLDVTLPYERLQHYFPKSFTPARMEKIIFQLLDAWQSKQRQLK